MNSEALINLLCLTFASLSPHLVADALPLMYAQNLNAGRPNDDNFLDPTLFSPLSAPHLSVNGTLAAMMHKAFPPEMFAAAYGNTTLLGHLLAKWPNVTDGANVKDWVDQTPLHLAAKFGKLETAKMLIENGANVNHRNRDFDETPLHLAAKSGYIDMVRLLIENQADVDAAIQLTTFHFPGGTPLTYAIETANSLDTVGLLVQLGGANVNIANLEGMTPLHLAVKNQNLALVKFLLDSGADIEAREKDGRSPLSYLVSSPDVHPQLPMIAFLLNRGAALESADKVGRTPLQNALAMGHKAVAKYLLEQGAKINTRGSVTGRTFLGRVVTTRKLRSVELVNFMLKHGANPNIGTADGCDLPLHDLAGLNRTEYNETKNVIVAVARLLVNYGADPNYKEPCDGTSALDVALENNYVQLAEVMQDRGPIDDLIELEEEGRPIKSESELAVTFSHIGVDKLEDIVVMMSKMNPKEAVAERDWLNQSALHVASFFGRAYVSMVLTCFGYDIHAKDVFGRTPLNNAARIGNIVLMEYLLDRNADIETADNDGLTPLLSAVKFSSSAPAVRFLINRGANVSAVSKDGLSALHVAAVIQLFEIMETLLEANISANTKTPYGETVLNYLLHSSCCYPQIPTVGLLLKYGADVNAADNNGYVPLHGAITSKKGSELILLLLYNGADPNAVNKQQCNSPIQLYVKNSVNDPSLSEEEIANTVRWMMAFGANATAPDRCYHNLSPLNLADRAGKRLVAQVLRNPPDRTILN